jgi:hypothetical protein
MTNQETININFIGELVLDWRITEENTGDIVIHQNKTDRIWYADNSSVVLSKMVIDGCSVVIKLVCFSKDKWNPVRKRWVNPKVYSKVFVSVIDDDGNIIESRSYKSEREEGETVEKFAEYLVSIARHTPYVMGDDNKWSEAPQRCITLKKKGKVYRMENGKMVRVTA